MTLAILVLLALITCFSHCYKVEKYPLLMPNVHPYSDELYLCTPVRVNHTRHFYIIGFEPKARMHTAHHILLYGCLYPGSSNTVWNCGEMANNDDDQERPNPCSDGSQIIYAWARDAPALKLPEGVGFKIGGDSSIQYLVLQVHYSHRFAAGHTDNSGVYLHYTEKPMNKLAGVLLLGTSGQVEPMQVTHMETACTIYEPKVLHPFAFRTHTHKLGKIVSGYRVRIDNDLNYDWTLLGKKDPQQPQMFYEVDDPNMEIREGDVLAARCTMNSTRTTVTYIGGTNKDEMCNFYLMYYVEGDEPLKTKYCFSVGPPIYSWRKSGLQNIPNIGASTFD
ncbi:peptidylglycine alpha-hydroxylating monooxygenase [Cimex lectularius]|uniref:peptidylglycine monooxygenase n=1 Tax=Cimex lectularius TaxID=79782 RepID=A0A8I6RND8_CIMLE|nr:peptidylglycine alpha-hydroxylating monooxygenase [Cimex lectularius]